MGISKEMTDIMNGIVRRLTDARDKEDEHEISLMFQRMVNKRLLPDYFDVIKEPVAFSTIRNKLLKKLYKNFQEFVRDFALISHNAQVYNRPSAGVYQDAVVLRELFKAELKALVDQKIITEDEAELPDLGEIPEVEDSPPPPPEEEEAEEDEDEDEDDEDEDDSDDDRPRRGRKKRRSSTALAKKPEDSGKDDLEAQKKRGRPPKVHTPMEARINTVLKGLRKFKNPGGDLKILPFEKLPDKTLMPEYYQEVKNPIAMDLIKRKAKRKKYHSVDQVLKDLDLMFENAKEYNLEESQVYKDAPDSDFVDEDGKLPLPEILYNGEVWKVGDWIHLTNGNDVTKPIVAQIYRTWQDSDGQKWINACWYYRPEQTVHRYEKHFYENEVVKTGQYRDHKIEEVVDRCFVMFFTRFNKGRPRGFPPDKEVYVCEARYNEDKHKLNKIKTWASCVPDEVRERDYEMDLFEAPRKMKKVPSPIKHLLREDAKEDDPLPKPTWGVPNAPPIVGAVHKRPREPNESPPPEPTPSPPPPSLSPVRRPATGDRLRYDSQGDTTMTGNSTAPLPSPMASQVSGPAQTSYGQQFSPSRPVASPSSASHLQHSLPYGSHVSASHVVMPQTPVYQGQQPYSQPATSATTPVAQHHHANIPYNQYNSTATVPRAVPQSSTSHASHANVYNPPRQSEIYTLSETANSAIPADVRNQFHKDDYGKVLFFTAPPLNVDPVPPKAQVLGHSLRYLADKARNKETDEKKRKARDARLEQEATERTKKMRVEEEGVTQFICDQKAKIFKNWAADIDRGTDELYKRLHGENWEAMRKEDTLKLIARQEAASKEKKELEAFKDELKNREEARNIGLKLT
ncbi:hypothetical protein OIDMADRAFT_198053 [Oidiodendron maius Zn]|uniref:Uncharacterized protein n=1 Tax=Oidiodendron maius (strain Zn) TaxID=913774 RepID=A0A0C3HCR2_OIDMZ|nr:hypothetical protein OIDMADRAFT_198053 [Oidiodendron maius Zn]